MSLQLFSGIGAGLAQVPQFFGEYAPGPTEPFVVNVGFPVGDFRRYGGVGNGTTDNATACANASAAMNAIPVGTPAKLLIPAGCTFYTTAGFAFTREVTVDWWGNVHYDDASTGIVMKMGPDGLTAADEATNRRYIVRGNGSLTGGLNCQHGIYFNEFITEPLVDGVHFDNFGGTSSWAVFAQASNWDLEVTAATWAVNSGATTQARNFVRLNGIYKSGTSDQGQSRLRMSQCLGTEQSLGAGCGVWINGEACVLENCKIEGFAPNVHVGAFGSYLAIGKCYFETTKGSECIRFGDDSGPDMGSYLQWLTIDDVFWNAHNTDAYATTANFLGYNTAAATSPGLQFATLRKVKSANVTTGRELVRLANLFSQTGNVASECLNSSATVLHTGGGHINSWNGSDELLTSAIGVQSDGDGIKHERVATGVFAPGGSGNVTITWSGPAFPDTNYTYDVTLEEATGHLTARVLSKTANSVTVLLQNDTAGSVSGTLNAIAFHD